LHREPIISFTSIICCSRSVGAPFPFLSPSSFDSLASFPFLKLQLLSGAPAVYWTPVPYSLNEKNWGRPGTLLPHAGHSSPSILSGCFFSSPSSIACGTLDSLSRRKVKCRSVDVSLFLRYRPQMADEPFRCFPSLWCCLVFHYFLL